MPIASLLDFWKRDPDTAPNLVAWQTLPSRPAQTHPFPTDLPAPVQQTLIAAGIHSLYSHQLEAWTYSGAHENIILSTGTASGKTLAYTLPVISELITNPSSRALYLFPTKALAQDQSSMISHQLTVLQSLMADHRPLASAIYDGDTPQKDRPAIRRNARILLSNPDMLHTGILPHHTNWLEFFSNLKFIVIDEAHTYRGVFGSHVANVIRRLKRVANFYHARPQFILASATIGNPKELAEKLIEETVHLIDKDGSARGPRHFLIYNPPLIDKALGLRKSSLLEGVRLARELVNSNIQTVVFARSRRSVEIILRYLQGELTPDSSIEAPLIPYKSLPDPRSFVRGYRSGYLPNQRREIEKGLRDGTIKTVVATNALELGIDIGGLGAAILVGYPGTVASARQQAGRAGRGLESAVALMVASANPIDQFLAHHPEYFFERSPEQALINPDHLLILLEHLRCAMFELPFQKGEGFGGISAQTIEEYLQFLVENNEAHLSNEKFFWMADQYPAANISLRSASPQGVVLQTMFEDRPQTIGTVDGESALWMIHPGAVYLHEAQQYFVQDLNLDDHIARLKPIESDYYTEPMRQTTVEVLSITAESPSPSGRGVRGEGKVAAHKKWGELQVTTQVTGFLKRRWYTHETLGQEPLDLPPTDLQTTGYWLSLAEETVTRLRDAGAWTNDPNDYGPDWGKIREKVRARDGYKCQICGTPETTRQHDVHHKIPFRSFIRNANSSRSIPEGPDFAPKSGDLGLQQVIQQANRLDNLITLCPSCHKQAEANVRMRSGLAGLAYVLGNLAPLFLMCDAGDLGTHIEPVENPNFGGPTVVLYDSVPAGIGFSEKLFEMHDELIARAYELVSGCACEDGCPSCVGPGGENGYGGKQEALEILKELSKGHHPGT